MTLLKRAAAIAIVLAGGIAGANLAGAATGDGDAFSSLKGGWSGGGSAKFASGESEKLKCTARYSGGGASLALSVKCASTSAQINLSGNLSASGNKVSGNWSENSFGLSGSASGSKSATGVRLKISGGAAGSLTMSVAGNSHSFSLSTQGSPLTGVVISMHRR